MIELKMSTEFLEDLLSPGGAHACTKGLPQNATFFDISVTKDNCIVARFDDGKINISHPQITFKGVNPEGFDPKDPTNWKKRYET